VDKLHITIHTKGKLAGIESLNTSSRKNGFCQLMAMKQKNICSHCYSSRLTGIRPALEKRLVENLYLLSEYPLKVMPKINSLYFRFHSFGELANLNHYMNFLDICKANPGVIFSLITKRRGIIKCFASTPQNLVLTYGYRELDTPTQGIPPLFDNSYAVYSDGQPCGEKCLECLRCYDKIGRHNIRQKIH
jgi:hypothetical protein